MTAAGDKAVSCVLRELGIDGLGSATADQVDELRDVADDLRRLAEAGERITHPLTT